MRNGALVAMLVGTCAVTRLSTYSVSTTTQSAILLD